MSALEDFLKQIKEELKEKEAVRQKLQSDVRKATSLSKQSILLIHQKKLRDAKTLLKNASRIIRKSCKTADMYPDVAHSGMLSAARQEYAEAVIFLKLVEHESFATPEEVNVPSIDYVLGLADVIGECRRLALDALREGDGEKGERCLEVMDEIYVELMSMDEAYMMVPGLRRKCDVARKVIEITRGNIT
ncbi:hypothetical protein KEJ15_02075, partial [Candidatus Bathyarchaeota archaeon]|nr:hypothetical protein [Candidatus Bathyarchaeota archaeon]